jgi:hypothetical protein
MVKQHSTAKQSLNPYPFHHCKYGVKSGILIMFLVNFKLRVSKNTKHYFETFLKSAIAK